MYFMKVMDKEHHSFQNVRQSAICKKSHVFYINVAFYLHICIFFSVLSVFMDS